MKYTTEERRRRISAILEADEDYQKMKLEYEMAMASFERFANHMPHKLRNLLWACPGMLYFMHHRTLTLVSEQMRFPDEV